MSKMTLKGLENTIEHYINNKDYESARNYVENFGDEFQAFDKEKALKKILNNEKGIKNDTKKEIKPKIKDKEE